MATATELVVAEELKKLHEIVAAREGWYLEEPDTTIFIIGLPARDQSQLWLLVECEGFPGQPPAFHWYNPETKAFDQPRDTPIGGTFLHGSGRICAPWNRLAYQQYDPKGPHGDWQFANWMVNPHTRGTKTIVSMVLRIFKELQSPEYNGRMEK